MGNERPSPGHVFISYAHTDSLAVSRLQRELEAAGIQVWRDRTELWPGQDWRSVIRRAINEDALVFVACFSRESLARVRSYQNEELHVAVEQLRQRRPGSPWLIPVRLDDCAIPDVDVGAGRSLASIQRVDLFGDQDKGIIQLVTAVDRVLGRETAAQTGVPATSTAPGGLRFISKPSAKRRSAGATTSTRLTPWKRRIEALRTRMPRQQGESGSAPSLGHRTAKPRPNLWEAFSDGFGSIFDITGQLHRDRVPRWEFEADLARQAHELCRALQLLPDDDV